MVKEWRAIKGYEGVYEVSNKGEVRRIKKPRKCMKKFRKNRDGYLDVRLMKDGITKTHRVHRLVAEAFLEKPEGQVEVNHKDEDKTNNLVTNLEWCTHEYNLNYGTYRERQVAGMKKPIAQLTLDGVEVARYPGIVDAAKALKKPRGDVNIISSLKSNYKTAYGFRWIYLEKEKRK